MKVFLVCSGLGRVRRGFESFTRECFDALAGDASLDIHLFKGKGSNHHREHALWNLPREQAPARWLGRLTGRGAYFVEQATFTFSLLWRIYRHRPDVIYFSDGDVGTLLGKWRRWTKQSYKLLLSNGAPFFLPFLRDCDYVQQLTPGHFQNAMKAGWPKDRQELLPYGINTPATLDDPARERREDLRGRLGLPPRGKIVLCVGAVDVSQKRLDYLIREVAALPEPRPYVLMLGQQGVESHEVARQAGQCLRPEEFSIQTVPAEQMQNFYQIADAFVLTSLHEGFGRVFMEAMSHGLPCLAHDYEVPRFVLGDEGYFADFRAEGSLTRLLNTVLTFPGSEEDRQRRHASIHRRFSWQALASGYRQMITRCAELPPKTNRG